MKQYLPGDKVVLPPYGVGVVKEIAVRKVVAGVGQLYYQVEFPGTRSRAFVPTKAPARVGLRPALTRDEVPEILKRLRTGRVSLPKQWAARHRRVTETIGEGNPHRIAVLAGQLRYWEIERGLPDLDRQAFRRAINLLAGEVSQALSLSSEETRGLFEQNWAQELN